MRHMRKLLLMVCAMALCGQMSAQSNDSIQHRLTGERSKGTYRECEEREKGKLNMGTQEVLDDRICETDPGAYLRR